MIVVLGEFRLPAENLAAGREAMTRVVEATRAEAGCLAYSYAEDVLELGLFRVSEQWESREALTVHFGAPHMTAWQRERAELGMTGRTVTAYEVSGEETL
jgi:quinol monooxygenase YgiN